MADTAMSTQQAGWYADPWGQAAQRWWDGQQWTPHVNGRAAAGPAAPLLAAPGTATPESAPSPPGPSGPWTTGPDGHVRTTAATAGSGPAGPIWYPGFGPQPRPAPPTNPLIKVLTLGGAALVALGSILTWAHVSAGLIEHSVSGLDGDGVLTLPGALLFGGLAASSLLTSWSTGRMVAALVVAALVGLVAAIDIADISSRVSDVDTLGVDVDVSIGIGLWLVLAGALSGIGGCIMALAAPKSPRIAG
jgi:Protein of unknown function (DUF2510)